MIDAIKKRSENMEKLREEHPKTWMELLTYFEIKMMFKDRTDLVTETAQLLKRAQRAEAALQEAVTREAVLWESLRDIANMKWDDDDDGIALGKAIRICEQCLANSSQDAAALLERVAELETQVADLRAALQAALLPLERAADALVPPGARVEEAAAQVEEAIVAIREELG